MTWSIASDIARMKSGERRGYTIGRGDPVEITYHERQAYGDNGKPVPGDTVGEFTVYWKPGKPNASAERIHVGPGKDAKRYHADQIADRMIARVPIALRHGRNDE